jgi:hypothetical protein
VVKYREYGLQGLLSRTLVLFGKVCYDSNDPPVAELQEERLQEIVIESRRKSLKVLQAAYPGAAILDVTSKAAAPWVKFSPFYPHGSIPVPFSAGVTAACVEGIWQGLKVFEGADIDITKFAITTMRGIKRTSRTYGAVRGHRKGVHGAELLAYREARYQLYLPSYLWVLQNCLSDALAQLAQLAERQPVLLLDYETNADIDNLEKPLSHAALIRRYLNHEWLDIAQE